MKLMNMIEHMAGTPNDQFSFYETMLMSMMIAGCILFGITMIACLGLGFMASAWFFAAVAPCLAAFCFCLTVVLFTLDK